MIFGLKLSYLVCEKKHFKIKKHAKLLMNHTQLFKM